MTVWFLISGKGNRFSLLRLWPTHRPIQRVPAAVAAWRHVRVEVDGHVVLAHHSAVSCSEVHKHQSELHSSSFFPQCAFGLCLVYVHEYSSCARQCRVCPPDVRKCDSTLLSSASINTLLFGRFLFVLLEEQHVDEDECGALIE